MSYEASNFFAPFFNITLSIHFRLCWIGKEWKGWHLLHLARICLQQFIIKYEKFNNEFLLHFLVSVIIFLEFVVQPENCTLQQYSTQPIDGMGPVLSAGSASGRDGRFQEIQCKWWEYIEIPKLCMYYIKDTRPSLAIFRRCLVGNFQTK